jgi:PEP-CTERM motif
MQRMRLAAALAAMLLATAASAGQLLSATYSTTISQVPLTFAGVNPTGTLVGNTFSLDAGSFFADVQTIPFPVPTKFPAATKLVVSLTGNGALAGNLSDSVITPTAGIKGEAVVYLKFFKAQPVGSPFVRVPIDAGAGGTVTTPPSGTTLVVQVKGDTWHIGAVTQTGLTTVTATNMNRIDLPDVMATGTVNVTAGGNTVVNLVSLGRTKVRGLANSDTSAASFLRLVYAPSVPEPGTLMLLGAGVAGLALIGRRKLQ